MMVNPVRVRLLFASAAAAASLTLAAGAQNVNLASATNGYNSSRADAEFMAYMAASVDTLVRAWESAVRRHDAGAIAALYTPDALLVLSSGQTLQGKGSVYDAFTRMLPRLKSARVNIARMVASGDVASVMADVDYEVKLPSGGAYAMTAHVAFSMKMDARSRLRIASQSGGDVQLLQAVDPKPQAAPGQRDSLRVRLTDASGIGVRGVLVSFELQQGDATLERAAAVTDGNGVAAAYVADSTISDANLVRAVAATLLDEPVFFTFGAQASGGATP